MHPENDSKFAQTLNKYRTSFHTPSKGRNWFGGHLVTMMPFFDESVCGFFNEDLAYSMATAERGIRNEASRRQQYYLVENAINRHCSCWEYLFQMLVHLLGLHEQIQSSRRGRDAMLGLMAYDIEFLPDGQSTPITYRPRELRKAIALIRKRRKEIDYLRVGSRAEAFFKEVDRTFARGSWLDEVKRLVRDSPVREIRGIRDTIVHNHPLGAKFRATNGGSLPGNSLEMKPDDTPPAELFDVLKNAHTRLEKAIRLTRKEVMRSNIPNAKENEGVEYLVRETRCSECGQLTPVPSPDPGEAFGKFFCQNCGLWSPCDSIEVVEELKTPEQVYGTLLRDRVVAVAGALNRLDQE